MPCRIAARRGKNLDAALERVEAVACRRGLSAETATGGYQLSKVVAAVDEAHGIGAQPAWQIGSGFAHGRPWAYLGLLHQERFQGGEPGLHGMRLTNTPVVAMYPILK